MGKLNSCVALSQIVWISVFTLSLCWTGTTAECPAPFNAQPCTCESKVTVRCDSKMYTTLPALPADTTSLQTYVDFYFNSNHISTITNGIYSWAKMFFLRNNGLKSIGIADNAFDQFSKLEVLDLSNNLLTELRKEMFAGLVNLKKLYVQGNHIKEVKSTYFSASLLPILGELQLGWNPLERIEDESFVNFTKLTTLKLAHCNFTSIPGKALSRLSALTHLELEGNTGLTEIEDGTFNNTSNLIHLQLGSCGLTTIKHNTFDGLTKLQHLYMSNNKISSICPKGLRMFDTPSFTALHLQSNKLKTLSKDALTWKNVKDLNLTNNPWDCNCHLMWMSAVLKTRSAKVNNVKCASPANLKGQLVTNVTKEDFEAVCPSLNGASGKKAIVLGIVIALVIIGVLLIGFFAWKIYKKRNEQNKTKKEVRYSAVYKDTVETNQNKPGQGLPTKPTSVL